MDSLVIKQLKINTKIGAHAWEQRIVQTLLLDITIPIRLDGLKDDDLSTVIDYDALCQKITIMLESHSFALIETVACRVADWIKEEYHLAAVDTAAGITVTVSKPHAVKNAGNIQVTVCR